MEPKYTLENFYNFLRRTELKYNEYGSWFKFELINNKLKIYSRNALNYVIEKDIDTGELVCENYIGLYSKNQNPSIDNFLFRQFILRYCNLAYRNAADDAENYFRLLIKCKLI